MPSRNIFNGSFNAGKALAGAVNGTSRQDGFEREQDRLMTLDKNRAQVDYYGAQKSNSDALAAKHMAESKQQSEAWENVQNPLNFAPNIAAATGADRKAVDHWISSLTGSGGPKAMPKQEMPGAPDTVANDSISQWIGGPKPTPIPENPTMSPEQLQRSGPLLNNFLSGKFAGKPSDIQDWAKSNDIGLRGGTAQSAISNAKTDPITAAMQLAVGNDVKTVPRLYDNAGTMGTFNTQTGQYTVNQDVLNKEKTKIAADRVPLSYRKTEDGNLEFIPGGPGALAADAKQIAREDRNEARMAREAAASEARTSRQQEATDRKVKVFSDTLTSSGIPAMHEALDNAKAIIEEMKITYNGEIPGYGKLVGILPDGLLSEDAQRVRQAIAKVSNIELKERSGTAVTGNEMTRYKSEIGAGVGKSSAMLLRGLQGVETILNAVKRNAISGVGDDVLNKYEENGGLMFDRSGRKVAPENPLPKAASPKSSATPSGNVGVGHKGHSEADIQATMRQYGASREEVIKRIDAKKGGTT